MRKSINSIEIRRIILTESKRADVGHIASALSITDIITVLFKKILNLPGTQNMERDRFILSKGHAALALYAALFLKGIIARKELSTYCNDGSLLGVHPENQLKGIDFSSGSLGHGLSIGVGVALGARMKGLKNRTFVLVSDAECNEGSLWEAVMFAAHHKLSNLVTIVDYNKQQAFGKTKDVIDLDPLGEKWSAFGWNVCEVDGHNESELEKAFMNLETKQKKPNVVIANTIAGKGVSFMEGQVKWHYLPMNDEEFARALKEVRMGL